MKMAAVRALAALAKEYVPEQVNMATMVDVYILISVVAPACSGNGIWGALNPIMDWDKYEEAFRPIE
jgi:malate dehydrogenase (oxaloacetate-decarboxylating)(NADP+)